MNVINGQRLTPLSVAQLGIWVAQMLDPRSPVYNIAEYIEILGPVELEVFRKATAKRSRKPTQCTYVLSTRPRSAPVRRKTG